MLVREVAVAAVEIVFGIESVTSVWRPEPRARGTPAREVRRLEDVFIVLSFAAETQVNGSWSFGRREGRFFRFHGVAG